MAWLAAGMVLDQLIAVCVDGPLPEGQRQAVLAAAAAAAQPSHAPLPAQRRSPGDRCASQLINVLLAR